MEGTGGEWQKVQRSLIGIWMECESGKEPARIDDHDFYSLRAIRDLRRDRCAAGRLDESNEGQTVNGMGAVWCDFITAVTTRSRPLSTR